MIIDKIKSVQWKKRLKSKVFLISFFSGLAIMLQALEIIKSPAQFNSAVNTLLYGLVLLGIITDPTSSGVFDKNGKFNWKSRLTNKPVLVALISGVALILQSFGLITLPDTFGEELNTLLSSLVFLGLVVDPTTPGISDSEIAQ